MNLGAIKVPDPRIDALAALFKPKKTTYAEMRFVDVPGPPARARARRRGAAGAGRGGRVLPGGARLPRMTARRADPRARAPRLRRGAGPARPRRRREAAGPAAQGAAQGHRRVPRAGARATRSSTRARRCGRMSWSEAEEQELAHFGFLSRRPLLVVVNVPEDDAAAPRRPASRPPRGRGAPRCSRSAPRWRPRSRSSTRRSSRSSSQSLGLSEPARARFLRAAYRAPRPDLLLHRGRRRGARLAHPPRRPRAARRRPDPLRPGARLHPRRGDPLRRLRRPRQRVQGPPEGKLRLEGKEYVVKDGDILNIRFAV